MTGVPALAVDGLRVSYGAHEVLHGVDLRVLGGTVHGLVGPNGSGKSTLLRAMAHLVRPVSGTVRSPAGRIGALTARHRAAVVAYLPQDTTVHHDVVVRDLVALGRYARLPRWGAPAPADTAAVAAAMRDAGVAELAGRNVRTLSGGQRQLVLLAKALAQEALVLLADEPVSALDLGHQLDLLAVLRALADRGRAVVVVLHDLGLAARFCDQLTVLDDGRPVASGRPDQVLTAAMLAGVYRVEAAVDTDPLLGVPRVTALRTLCPDPPADPAGPTATVPRLERQSR